MNRPGGTGKRNRQEGRRQKPLNYFAGLLSRKIRSFAGGDLAQPTLASPDLEA
jgi:hypothetical protein